MMVTNVRACDTKTPPITWFSVISSKQAEWQLRQPHVLLSQSLTLSERSFSCAVTVDLLLQGMWCHLPI